MSPQLRVCPSLLGAVHVNARWQADYKDSRSRYHQRAGATQALEYRRLDGEWHYR